MGAILFLLLFLIVLRADRLIERGYRSLLRQQQEMAATQSHRVQSARLAAVGELVSGVAHELNNPLTGIWGKIQLMRSADVDPALENDLAVVQQETERSIRIVQNLLSFSRGSSGEKQYLSINQAVESAIELRRYELQLNNVTLDQRLQPDLPYTMVDAHQIQQVALNLIVNAEQAMVGASGGGALAVVTDTCDGMVRFSVTDSGPGIPPEAISKLFDPFFTTKDVGKGTGLGLSISFGIIRDHGGRIRAENSPAGGARFIVEIPVVSQGSQSPVARAIGSSESQQSGSSGGALGE